MLHESLTAIREAGYLAVPNLNILLRLKSLEPAFWGGLFFTLTVGAAMSLISMAAWWGWDRVFSRNPYFFVPAGIFWASGLIASNFRGFCPTATSHIFFIPPVVFALCSRWMPDRKEGQRIWPPLVSIFFVMGLSAVLFIQVDLKLFVDIRDKLLLSNPVGEKINAFYYRYTMYPAELFKSLDQKLLKTCRLKPFDDMALARRVELALMAHDYLAVNQTVPVDLTVEKAGQFLTFYGRGKAILRTTPKKFFRNPQKSLRSFSAKSDRNLFLRKLTMFSLFLLLPVLGYGLLYLPLRALFGSFMAPLPASAISSAVVMLLLAGLSFFVLTDEVDFSKKGDLAAALNSSSTDRRVAALQHLYRKKMDVGQFPSYRRIAESPHAVERYWLARALGVSRAPDTLAVVHVFLDDPHPNVVCMAFHALRSRKDREAVDEIQKRIRTSDHWYVQWYAYKALKELGWKQTRSN